MRKPIYWLLLLLLINGCVLLQSRSVREAASIVGEDGDRELRKPMRPIRGGTRVLVFALDGVGNDDFLAAVRSGRLPRTSELLGDEADEEGTFDRAFAASDVLSVLPSSTGAAWTSAFTGEPPGRTGVPGNEWFDRDSFSFHAPNPVSTDRRYQVLGSYNEDRLGRLIRVPTLFERAGVRAHVSLLHVYRGADMINIPEIEPFGTLFNAGLSDVFGADSSEHRFYAKLDEISIKSLEESLERYGVADLQVVYFPGIDLFTHIAASPIESQQHYLETVIDPAIGQVLDIYAEADVLEQTYVLFVSDHGQTPVLPESSGALWRERDDEPPELLRQAGFRVRDRALKTDRDDYQAVLAMQGGMAYVYLADRSSCPDEGMSCDWSRPPRTDEDLMVAARMFYEANRTGAHVPRMKDAIDLILARVDSSSGSDAPPFEVFDGDRLVPLATYLHHNPRPDLLDLENRLADLATGPHGHLAGDILLLSRMSLDVPLEDRTYFGTPYHTWHGSANAYDSRVLFALAHPAMYGSALGRLMRDALDMRDSRASGFSQVDLTPLILHLLGRS